MEEGESPIGGIGSEEEADSGSHYRHDDPLYAGAAITVGVAMTLLLAFIIRHKLTNEAISDLLYLSVPSPTGVAKHCTNLKSFSRFWLYHLIAVTTVHSALILLVIRHQEPVLFVRLL